MKLTTASLKQIIKEEIENVLENEEEKAQKRKNIEDMYKSGKLVAVHVKTGTKTSSPG